MKKNNRKNTVGNHDAVALEKRRRMVETTASFGLLIVAVALAVPFANLYSGVLMQAMMWVYAAGAVMFTVARVINVNGPDDSLRLRRLRRIEAWAGIAFCVAAGFWFYNWNRFGAGMLAYGPMTILRDTILFTLVGAALQLISSWMIYARAKKEEAERNKSGKDEK